MQMSFAFAVIKTTKESKIDRTERKQSRSFNHYNHKLPKKATLDRNVFIVHTMVEDRLLGVVVTI